MNVPKDTIPMIWGAVIGAAACAILGFTWGGWVTGSTARKDAGVTAHNATVVALAPFCAERFRAQGDAPAKMAELAKASTWERTTVVEKSAFAVMPGTKSNDSNIARACVELLMATASTPATSVPGVRRRPRRAASTQPMLSATPAWRNATERALAGASAHARAEALALACAAHTDRLITASARGDATVASAI